MSNVIWKECHFVVIDVEGNGQSPQEIIELSIVPVFREQISRSHSWLIRPQRRVTERATKIHGISNNDLMHCRSSEEVENEIRDALGHHIVVGHNVSIDTQLIRNQFGDWFPVAILDTLKLAKYVQPRLSSYSLDALISNYNLKISPTMRHRASGDAQATAQLFLALVSNLEDSQRDLHTLAQIAGSVDDPFLKNQQKELILMAYFVGVAGTHSTGKSTFIESVKKQAEENGISVAKISDTATKCQEKGFLVLENHTFESTLWIIVSVIKAELEAEMKADLVLVDRPVPDALGYLEAALKYQGRSITSQQKKYLDDLVKYHSSRYNLILKTELNEAIPIGDNRPPNMEFRRNAALEIDKVFEQLEIPYLSPNDEETQKRIREIFNIISEKEKTEEPI